MGGWSEEPEAGPVARPWDKPVAAALRVPEGVHCPGEHGLCAAPLLPGQALCPSCAGTGSSGPSAKLLEQIALPTRPECTRCSRPVDEAGALCARCQGRPAASASPVLQAAVGWRPISECPGDGGLCGVPLEAGEPHCARCREGRAPAPAAVWERCSGQGRTCRRQVLPGRGQCLACRQAAGVSRIITFSADGAKAT